MHPSMHASACMRLHACVCMHLHASTHAPMHAWMHAVKARNACMHTRENCISLHAFILRTCSYACMHTCMDACMHVQTHQLHACMQNDEFVTRGTKMKENVKVKMVRASLNDMILLASR